MNMKKPLAIFVIVAVCTMILVVFIARRIVPEGTKAADSPKTPQRIVSLSPNLTEILFALGLGDKIVAVSNNCDWPVEAKAKPKVGTFWQPNTEAIIAVRPDLVVCETFDQQQQVAQTLKRTGLNVLSMSIESLDELYTAIMEIGDAAGCKLEAEQLVAYTKDQLDKIKAISSSAEKVKVLWVVQNEPMRLAGVNTFVNEIIEMAGGQNAIAPTATQYPSVPTEEIIRCGAEVIIQAAMGTRDLPKQQAAAEKFWAGFTNLPAVKNKRIYVIDPDTVLRLGPRLPQGVQAVLKCLHPELFARPHKVNHGMGKNK